MAVVSKLREVRERTGPSISQISRDTGIARSSLHKYENGTERPSLDTAFLLARYLKVPLEEIFVPVHDQRHAS